MDTATKSPSSCCADERCDSGRRNRYFPHKHISADTYQVEQSYQQQRRHLLNRAIHGWGVVYGYAIAARHDANRKDAARYLEICSGLALDECGRELLWTGTQCAESQRVDMDDLLELDCDGKLLHGAHDRCIRGQAPPRFGGGNEKTCWLLRVHYAERLIAPVSLRDPCHCDQQEWDQVCETVRFSLQPLEDCDKCCERQGCCLDCDCHGACGRCCPDHAAPPAERGGCRCLCDHLTRLDPNPECCTLTSVGKGLKVDLLHGVPLACISLMPGPCDDVVLNKVEDDCGPRRLVKRNDLLFDLIRGCDLARISDIGWKHLHRQDSPVEFKELRDLFGSANTNGARRTNIWVKFSKPVQNETIRPDCFTIAVIARTDEDGWGRTLRVPIVAVDRDHPHDAHHCLGATVLVDSDWVEGALDDISVFAQLTTRVEITVRGDYLLDCNGLAVDANARGLAAVPTGNGTPGDTFISTFLVQPMKPGDYKTKSSYEGV